MSSSSALKCSLVLIIMCSVAWKVAMPPPSDNQTDPNISLVKFLEDHDFSVAVTEQAGIPIIEANNGSCHLEIARLNPNGSNEDLVRYVATGADHSFIIFRGQAYTQQPIFWTMLDYLWSRSLLKLGFIHNITPILAVGADSTCDVERLPWSALREAFDSQKLPL